MRDRIVLFIVSLFSFLPLSLAQLIGGALGRLFYLIPNVERHIAWVNINICFPDMSSDQKKRLLKESMIETSRGIAEIPVILRGAPERWIDMMEQGVGADLYEAAMAQGRGVIAVGPHQGNWEVGLHYLNSLAPVTALYRPPRQKDLDNILRAGRSQGGASLVPATPQGVKSLYLALRRGEMMAVLADQQPKAAGHQGGVYVPFFGIPALTMVLVGRLASKTGAPVLFWFAERLPHARGYRMHWFKAPLGVEDRDPEVAAAAMNVGLETCIRHVPSQYLWSYRRFSGSPEPGGSPYHRSYPF